MSADGLVGVEARHLAAHAPLSLKAFATAFDATALPSTYRVIPDVSWVATTWCQALARRWRKRLPRRTAAAEA